MDGDLLAYALRTLDEDLALHDWAVRVFGSGRGVRMALGATAGDIAGSVFAQGMRQVALGLAVGLAAALALTRLLRAMLAGMRQPDASTFLTVVALLLMAGVAACAIPARRATSVDPAVTLRFE